MRARSTIWLRGFLLALAFHANGLTQQLCDESYRHIVHLIPEMRVKIDVQQWSGFNAAVAYSVIVPPELRPAIAARRPLDKNDLPKIEKWALNHLQNRLEGWRATSDGRLMSLMTAFSGEGIFHDNERLFLRSIRNDVAVFGGGHGMPGGKEFSVNIFENSGTPFVAPNTARLTVSGDALMRYFAAQPGVRKSRVIFLNSCNGALATPTESAAAQRLAEWSGVDVIAAVGNLAFVEHGGKLRFSVLDPEANRIFAGDEAFLRFPAKGGAPQRLSFLEMKALLFREKPPIESVYREPREERR